jgi:hypothetical protein
MSSDARCSLLPPRDHGFWRDPDAVEHAIQATISVEQARLDAVAAVDEAHRRAKEQETALAKCQAEVRMLREMLAASRVTTSPQKGLALGDQAAALAEAQSTAQNALAEAATLRAALDVERTRARDAAKAAFVAASRSAPADSTDAALRCELLEERMRVRELQQQLVEQQVAIAEQGRLRERMRHLQAALDAERARCCDLQANLAAREGTPSPPLAAPGPWQQR